jgi:hypothetical protein
VESPVPLTAGRRYKTLASTTHSYLHSMIDGPGGVALIKVTQIVRVLRTIAIVKILYFHATLNSFNYQHDDDDNPDNTPQSDTYFPAFKYICFCNFGCNRNFLIDDLIQIL